MKYSISYRSEFTAEIEADSEEQAINKFKRGDCTYELLGNLWGEYIEVGEV